MNKNSVIKKVWIPSPIIARYVSYNTIVLFSHLIKILKTLVASSILRNVYK